MSSGSGRCPTAVQIKSSLKGVNEWGTAWGGTGSSNHRYSFWVAFSLLTALCTIIHCMEQQGRSSTGINISPSTDQFDWMSFVKDRCVRTHDFTSCFFFCNCSLFYQWRQKKLWYFGFQGDGTKDRDISQYSKHSLADGWAVLLPFRDNCTAYLQGDVLHTKHWKDRT